MSVEKILEACNEAKAMILEQCRKRAPEANGGLGLATPEEQVAVGWLAIAIDGLKSQYPPPAGE